MRAVLVSIDFGDIGFSDYTEEFVMLSQSAGAVVVDTVIARRSSPDAKFFVGSGKLEEINLIVQAHQAEIVIFNHALSPAQQRNIERVVGMRVVDRVSLILDIFALRAQSHEGKLQVELAQLQHLITRLTRLWTHLERQRGGIGLRGPGESQLEMDKRIIGDKVKVLKSKLLRLTQQRQTQRKSRARGNAFSVSLVGYTNAGKSTVFHALSRADVYIADQLFATLDTTTRKVWLEEAQKNIVLSDTVGFIRELPHMLVAAFRATLEETIYADLLIHVVDISNAQAELQMQEVDKVLQEIKASHIPQLIVCNKIDKTDIAPKVERNELGLPVRVYISATEKKGLDFLRACIAEFEVHLNQLRMKVSSDVHADDPRFRSQPESSS